MDNDTEIHEYNYHGQNITLPAEDTDVYVWGLAVLTVFLTAMGIYIVTWSKIPEDLYRCLTIQHILSGSLHVTCLTIYNLRFSMEFMDEVLKEAYSCLDLVITFTTGCLSWIVFLRLFLFRNGEELYSMKQLTLFSTLSLGVIEAYEYMMSLLDLDQTLISALRLTSVLLIMTVPIVVFMLLLKTLCTSSTEVPKFQALFFMGFLLLFIVSDSLLLKFNLYTDDSFRVLWSVFLFVRLFIEIVFYIICDRFMSNFLTY